MNNKKFKGMLLFLASVTATVILVMIYSSLAQAFSSEDLYYFEIAAQNQDRTLLDTSQRPEIIECIKYGTNCPDYGYIVQVHEYWIHSYGRLDSSFLALIVDVDGQIHIETDLTSYFEDGGNFLVSLENGAVFDLRNAVDMNSDIQLSQGSPMGASGNDEQSPFSDDPSEGFFGSCSSMNDLKGCPYIPSETKSKKVSEPQKVGPGSQSYPYGDAPGVDFHYHQQGRGGGSGTNPSGPDTFLDAITDIDEMIRGGVN